MRTIYMAGPVQTDSIVDGEGLRTVIWFQGCPHNCLGCHNPESHTFKTGIKTTTTKVIAELEKTHIQDGVTFSGGEPLAQPEALLELAKYIKGRKENIWCYTGFLFDKVLEMAKEKPIYFEILKYIDVLIDGPFMLEQRSFNVKFRGSKNQRIIDVKKSIKNGKISLIPKYKKEKQIKKPLKVNLF